MAGKGKKAWVRSKVVSVAAFLAGFAIVGGIINYSHNNSVSQPSNYLTSSTSFRPYTSAQYGFTINFPGNPTASNSNLQIQGMTVPMTNYERDNNDGNTDFFVSVDSYPSSFDMSDTKARLEGALNGEVENVRGATLISSSFGTLDGYTAITGHSTVTEEGQTFEMYDTSLLKGNTLFNILTVGASEADFHKFADSFHFN